MARASSTSHRVPDRHGFGPGPFDIICRPAPASLHEDWAAINTRFVVPDNAIFMGGLIPDRANDVSIRGYDDSGAGSR